MNNRLVSLQRMVSFGFMPLVMGVLLLIACPSQALAKAPAWTAEPAFVVSPETLLAEPSASTPEDGPVEVLLDSVRTVYDEDGRVNWEMHLIYRIHAPQQLGGWGAVYAQWAPWYQSRPVVKARVISPSGEVVWLDETHLVESTVAPEGPVYSDSKAMEAPLPRLVKGAIVEVSRVVSEHEPFARYTGSHFTVGNGVPTRHARLVVKGPPGDSIAFVAPDGVEPPRIHRKRTGETLTWSGEDLPALSLTEGQMPSDYAPLPYIYVAMKGSWEVLAKDYEALIQESMDLSGAEGLVVSGEMDRAARVNQTLERLREQVRYTGIEFGGNAIVPFKPAEVLKRGYGDCKDQATAVVMALREADVEAYVALLRTGPGSDVNPSIPVMNRFNHAIVYVPGEPAIWVDPTDSYAAVGRLPYWDQGRRALVIGSDTETLVQTPLYKGRVELDAQVTMGRNGEVKGRLISTLKGAPANIMRRSLAGVDSAEERATLTRSMAQTAFGAHQSPTVDWSGPDDDPSYFQTTVEAVSLEGHTAGARTSTAVGQLYELMDWVPNVLKAKPVSVGGAPRIHPVQLYPVSVVMDLTVTAPPYQRVATLPPNDSWTFGPASLSETWSREGDQVLVHWELDLGPQVYTADQVNAFREAWHGFGQLPNTTLDFGDPALVAQDNGQFERSFALLLPRVAADPTDEYSRMLLSEGLRGVGLEEQASQRLRELLEEKPENSEYWATLGWSLMVNSIGEEMTGSWKREQSVEALRHATSLPNADGWAWQTLAIALATDSNGRVEWREAVLTESLQAFDRAESLGYSGEYTRMSRAYVELRAGQYEEALAHLKSLQSDAWIQALQAVCLYQLGRIDEATRMYRDVLPANYQQTVVVLLFACLPADEFAQAVERLKADRVWLPRKEKAKESRVERQIREAWRQAVLSDDLESLLSSSLSDNRKEVLLNDLRCLTYALSSILSMTPHSTDERLLALAYPMQFFGDGKTARKMDIRLPLTHEATDFFTTWWVLEGRQWRLRARGGQIPSLADEGLKRLERGKQEEAAQWFTWIQQEQAEIAVSYAKLWEGAYGSSPSEDLEQQMHFFRFIATLFADRKLVESEDFPSFLLQELASLVPPDNPETNSREATAARIGEMFRGGMQIAILTIYLYGLAANAQWDDVADLAAGLKKIRPDLPPGLAVGVDLLLAPIHDSLRGKSLDALQKGAHPYPTATAAWLHLYRAEYRQAYEVLKNHPQGQGRVGQDFGYVALIGSPFWFTDAVPVQMFLSDDALGLDYIRASLGLVAGEEGLADSDALSQQLVVRSGMDGADDVPVGILRALVLGRQGRVDEALAMLQQTTTLGLDPDDAVVKLVQAQRLHAYGFGEEAAREVAALQNSEDVQGRPLLIHALEQQLQAWKNEAAQDSP